MISVIMPVYNIGNIKKSAVNSVYFDFEFIILNDGSKDNTYKY